MIADLNTSDPTVAVLTGSSPSTGAPPAFEPIVDGDGRADPARPVSVGEDPSFAAIKAHQLASQRLAAIVGDIPPDAPEDAAEEQAFTDLLDAEPTTVAGLKAWVAHLLEVWERTGDYTAAERALPAINSAVATLLRAAPLSPVGTAYDAELIALGKEMFRLWPLVQKAYEERYRLEALRNDTLPAVPAGLLSDPDHRLSGDIEHFTAYTGDGCGTTYYTAQAIERLRTIPRTKLINEPLPGRQDEFIKRRVPDDEAQARVPAIILAFEEWDSACKRHSAEVGYDAALLHHKDLEQQIAGTFRQIEAAAPVTLQGLAVQADAMLLHPGNSDLRFLITDRLHEFAAASPKAIAADRDPAALLFSEAGAVLDRVNSQAYASDKEGDALMDRLREIKNQMVGTRAQTAAGALASINWAMEEFREFWLGWQTGEGESFMMALLDSARVGLSRHLLDGVRDGNSDLVQLGAELEEMWRAERKIYESHPGSDASSAELVQEAEATERTGGVVERIKVLPATTIDELKIKARALMWCRNVEHPEELTLDFGGPATTDFDLIGAIVSDLFKIRSGTALLPAMPKAAPDRRALEAYATWLHHERRLLLIELYGKHEARRMERVSYENAGGVFHYPSAGSWRDVPAPSTRAERWLDLLGVDWRSDENDRSDHVERTVAVMGKVA